MCLAAGVEVGRYRVLELVAAGGMGEVYRALDTRLERPVALKILPRQLYRYRSARERFAGEARTTAALSHPNICSLYDVGDEAGIAYFVLELLAGETLDARLRRGAMPVREAVEVGTQVASALDHVHRCGFVHRDVKPSNIMLTDTGARLLDFGISIEEPSPDLEPDAHRNGDEAEGAITDTGALVGTLQYMAPEQLEERPVDSRVDIFALGAVLYEAVSGKRAFPTRIAEGRHKAIALRADFSLSRLSPPPLDRVIQRCLAWEPEERWQLASELEGELASLLDRLASRPASKLAAAAG